MEKIDIDVFRETEEYKEYLKILIASNNSNCGFDRKHDHETPWGKSTQVIGNNFFLHQHAVGERLLGRPMEYDSKTLEHNHFLEEFNRNECNEEIGKIKIVKR